MSGRPYKRIKFTEGLESSSSDSDDLTTIEYGVQTGDVNTISVIPMNNEATDVPENNAEMLALTTYQATYAPTPPIPAVQTRRIETP